MRPLGYLYKRITPRPDWLKAQRVSDIYSLSACISQNFADYINYWKHNGFWLFDSPRVIEDLAAEHAISLEGTRLFYYEGYEREFDAERKVWTPYEPEAAFRINVMAPLSRTLEGFDVACFSVHTSPECSPLSCNGLAETLPTNAHCLFRTFEDAERAIESGQFERSEPSPYRIIAVYSVGGV
jgi:hypothetical protein